MEFRVIALDPAPFRHLYARSDAELAASGVGASLATAAPGFPCRVTLEDARPGERVLLLNHEHLPAATPYRSRHAIFVRDGAEQARPVVGEVPEYLGCRLLSVRGFDAGQMMTDADVVDGREAAPLFRRLLADPRTEYLHVHTAKQGCYLARIERG